MHLLFVCTGNICRSPVAERLTTAFSTRLAFGLTASSAGTHAAVGHSIHKEAADIIEAYGGDISNFSARQMTPKIANSADLVLTMTRDQRDLVMELAPRQFRKTFTLYEAAHLISNAGARDLDQLADVRWSLPASEIVDICDPIGQSAEVFQIVGAQIASLLDPVLNVCRCPPPARA